MERKLERKLIRKRNDSTMFKIKGFIKETIISTPYTHYTPFLYIGKYMQDNISLKKLEIKKYYEKISIRKTRLIGV